MRDDKLRLTAVLAPFSLHRNPCSHRGVSLHRICSEHGGVWRCVFKMRKRRERCTAGDVRLGTGQRERTPPGAVFAVPAWRRLDSIDERDRMRLELRSISDSYDSWKGHVNHFDVQGCNLASIKA